MKEIVPQDEYSPSNSLKFEQTSTKSDHHEIQNNLMFSTKTNKKTNLFSYRERK